MAEMTIAGFAASASVRAETPMGNVLRYQRSGGRP